MGLREIAAWRRPAAGDLRRGGQLARFVDAWQPASSCRARHRNRIPLSSPAAVGFLMEATGRLLPARIGCGVATGLVLRPETAGLFLIVSRRNRSQMRAALTSLVALGHRQARRRLTIAIGSPSGSHAHQGFLPDASGRAPRARCCWRLPTSCPDTESVALRFHHADHRAHCPTKV